MKFRFLILFLLASLYANGQRIFWTQDGSINQIRSANMDGTDIQTHLTDPDGPRYLSVDRTNNILFYITQSPNRAKRVNLTTFGSSILIYDWPAMTAAVNLAHHPGDQNIYFNEFVDSDDVIIARSQYTDQDCCQTPQSLDLGTLVEFGNFFDINIDTDFEKVYTSYEPLGRIYSRPTFASGAAATPTVIVPSGGGESFDVDFGDRRLVYEDPINDRIVVRDMDDGSGFAVLISSGFTDIRAINVDQQQSRVVVLDGTSIKTAENNGLGLTTVLSGLTSAEDISIMRCSDPTTQVSGLTASAASTTSIDLTWSNGSGDNTIIVAKEGSAVDQAPRDGILSTASTLFGNGDELGTDNFVVYRATGTSTTVTGLSPATEYHFSAYTFDSFGACYRTSAPSIDNAFTSCNTPTASATAASTGSLTTTTTNLSWTGGDGGGSLLVLKEGSAVDFIPVDLTDYGPGDSDFGTDDLGGGNFLIANTTGNTASITGLSPSTTYHYAIYEYNNTGAYCYGPRFTNSFVTLCQDPSVQASGLQVDGTTFNSINLSWTAGNSTARLVLAKQASTYGSTPIPVDNTNYTASPIFGSGTDLGGAFVVFNGSGTSVTVTGLDALMEYSFAVFEYNDVGGQCYLETLSGANTVTDITDPLPEPLEHVSGFSVDGVGLTTVDLSWVESVNAQLAEGYLLQAIADGNSFPTVVDGTAQADDTNFADGVAAVNLAAGATSFQFTTALPGVSYTFRIYPYTNSGLNIDYKTDGTIPEQTANTLASTDSDVIASSPFSIPTGIDYLSFLGGDATNSSFLLAAFDIRDGGAGNDADPVPTVLTGITFSIANSSNLSRVALYQGSTELGEVAAAPTATFSGLTVSTGTDNGIATIDVYVTFNTTVTDNQQIDIQVSNVTSLPASSGFASANGGGANLQNAPIEVVATAVNILQQPSTTADQYVALPQQPIFEAVDVNDNLDVDFAESFIVGTADIDDLIPVSALTQFSSGLADFSGSGLNFEGVGTSTMHILTTGPSAILSPNTVSITVSGTVPTVVSAPPTDDMACVGGDGTIEVTDVTPGVLSDYTFELFDDVPASVSTNGPLFTDLEAGNYTVIATNINSGISSPSFPVTVDESLPVIGGTLTIASGSSTSICAGESTNLSVAISGGSDPYELQIDDGSSVSTIDNYMSGDPIPVTPASNTTYTLTSLVDGSGCSGTVNGSVFITVNPNPTIVVTPTANSGCNPFNGELDFMVTGSSGDVDYNLTGELNLNFTATATETLISLAPGDYTVTATDNVTSCTSAPFNVIIEDNSDRPIANVGSDVTICEGDDVTLSGSASGGDGNYTYAWDNAGTLNDPDIQNPIASPTVNTTYTVIVTDGFGCESDPASVTVTVSPLFQSATLNNSGATTICEGDVAIVNATMVGGTGPYSFMLSDGTSITNYTSGSDISLSPTTTTTYSISSIEDAFSCAVQSITGSVTIQVDQSPSTATVGADDAICTVTYANLGGNTPGIGSGIWTTNGSASIDDPLNPQTGVSNLSFGANEFTWTITNGICTQNNNATIIITRQEPPTGSGIVQGSAELCSDAQGVNYTVSGILGATEYSWILPSGFSANSLITADPNITVNLENGQSGSIEVTGSNECGNITAESLVISIIPAAEVSINVPDEIKPGQEVQFSFTSSTPLSITAWSFGDGGASSEQNPVYSYERSGNYTILLDFQNVQGCTGSASLPITVVPRETVSIKNAVTPNGDGQNDFLVVEGILDYPDNVVTLFDRWGVEVAQFNGYTNDWDLIIGGDYIPAGNYICVVELPEIGETIKRSVTVVKGN